VHVTGDGSWSIAGERAAGCEVRVTRQPAAFEAKRTLEATSLTAVSSGFAALVSAEAHRGAVDAVEIDIHNREVLRADLRGPCGDHVVSEVFVGRGRRSLMRRRSLGGKLGVRVGPVTPSAGHDEARELADALSWAEDSAYGFNFARHDSAAPLRVRVTLPPRVTEGDMVRVQFEVSRPAWLVVYYLEQSGHGAVLWPSDEEPAPRASPGQAALLPSPAERAAGVSLTAALAEPGAPARETLVVYAFAEEADFQRVKPSAGDSATAGAELAASLTERIEQLPLSRWARATAHYTIEAATTQGPIP
jgi:hypothetical protein